MSVGNYLISMRELLVASLLVLAVMASPEVYGEVSSDDADSPDIQTEFGTAIEPYVEYRKQIESVQNIAPLDAGLFGEGISLYNGSTRFTVVDIEVPGNSLLPVRLARSHAVEIQPQRNYSYDETLGGLGNWSVDVPYMAATYPQSSGWNADRCSSGSVPPLTIGPNGTFYRSEFWQGITVHVPGRGDVAALGMQTQTPRPTSGGPYRLTTNKRDVFECIHLTIAGRATGEEGFRMTTASGVRYYFDVMTTRNAATLEDSWWSSEGTPQTFILHRDRYYLLASKVEDRFGNWVQFSYNSSGHPTRIWSNDGREIVLSYASGRLSSATSHGETWNYQYQPVGREHWLETVTRPDGSEWHYDYSDTLRPGVSPNDMLPPLPECQQNQPIIEHSYSLVATHPSGAIGTFSFNNRRHYRSGVHAGECVHYSLEMEIYKLQTPHYFDVMSLDTKSISGPGLTTMNWQYDYGGGLQSLWGSYGEPFSYPCETCDLHKTATVTEPDDSQRRYRFGILYHVNGGRELQVETLAPDDTVLRTEVREFLAEADVDQQPFHGEYGSVLGNVADPVTARIRPQIQRTITQQGTDFYYDVNSFDNLGRPLQVTRSSSQNAMRSEQTAYHDNLARWILGQTASITVGSSTPVEVAEETTYDATWAVPLVTKRFGKTVQTLGWNLSSPLSSGQRGTIETVTDGNNNTTTLTNWKRGTPQAISYADGESTSAEVNEDGTIGSITDENGYKTCYAYDGLGRLEQITWPSESQSHVCNTSTWNPTTQTFVQATTGAYGLPAGHWRQTVSTGDGREITYFDALWRPLLVREYDAANQSETERFQRFEYDHDGRTTFASYPSSGSAATSGVHTSFDALGRERSVVRDSEFGPLTTTTEYSQDWLGYHTIVTNPRGNVTKTWYLAFDEPGYKMPLLILHPEDAYTLFARDHLGQVDWVGRGRQESVQLRRLDLSQVHDLRSTTTAARDYVHNTHRELCKVVEPEAGATIMSYDGAGNLAWSKSGSSHNGTSSCNTGNIPQAERTVREYDQRNRITAIEFPDGRGNTTYTYWADGSLRRLHVRDKDYSEPPWAQDSNQFVTTYEYNHRGLLVSEEASLGLGSDFMYVILTVVYGYNPNAFVASQSSQTYGHGPTVTFEPNGLGQPTRVGAFATNAVYHPNGAIRQFTYGNGIIHVLAQNDRGLPERSVDSYGNTHFQDEAIDYDESGNVVAISDGATGMNQRGNRNLAYDQLDRLTSVSSPMFGVATYSYDELDNLTRTILTGGAMRRDFHLCYDNNFNHLISVRTGSCSGIAVIELSYDTRGNVVGKDGVTFDFDYGNRLRNVPGSLHRIIYDGHGRRVRDDAGTSIYTSDGRLTYASGRLSGDALSFFHYLGSRLVAIEEYESLGSNGNIKYQHTDALGSPVVVTDANQNILERREYEPYGMQLQPTPEDGVGYTGHVYDAATGLNYMQQRYYDPMIGRFLSVDPVATDPETGASFNRYWYANNNPYRYVDPDGRYSTCAAYAEAGNAGPCAEIPDVTGESFNTLLDASQAASAGLMRLQEGSGHEYGVAYSQNDDGTVSPTVAVAGSRANPEGDPNALNISPLLEGTYKPIGDGHTHPDNVGFERRSGGYRIGSDLPHHEIKTGRYARAPGSAYTSYVYRRIGDGRGAADMAVGRLIPNPNMKSGSATHVVEQKSYRNVFQIEF